MPWFEVAKTSDIGPGKTFKVEVNSRSIMVCNTGESIYAIDNICTHDGGPLDQGFLEGNEIECPRHGARFDVRNGKVTRLPAVRPIRPYSVRTTGDVIEIEVP